MAITTFPINTIVVNPQDVFNAVADAQAAARRSNVYVNTAAGIADTAIGDQFDVIVGDESIRYRHDAGPVAVEVARYPTSSAVDVAVSDIATLEKITYGPLKPSRNLFDKNAQGYTTGVRINRANGTTAVVAGWAVSDYIPVTPSGQVYISDKNNFLGWYTAAKLWISDASVVGNVQDVPPTAAFLRTSVAIVEGVNPDRYYVANGALPIIPYQPPGGIVDADRVFSLTEKSLNDAAITERKTSFLTKKKNLFIRDTATMGAFKGSNGNFITGNATADLYILSDYIEVEPGETYYGMGDSGFGMRFWAAFDADKNVVTTSGSNAQGATFTVPASGVSYYQVSIFRQDLRSFQLEKGAAATTLGLGGYDQSLTIFTSQRSNWEGKKWAALGDSLTAQREWIFGVLDATGARLVNLGIGGKRYSGSDADAIWQTARVNATPSDSDLVTLLGGTNDWAQDAPLGAADSVDTDTFYGALNVTFSKVVTRCPNALVLVITPPFSSYPGRAGFLDDFRNSLGLTTRDYSAAIRARAIAYGLPVLDFDREAGINEINVQAYHKPDGAFLHPNDTLGGPRLAAMMLGWMRSRDPVGYAPR